LLKYTMHCCNPFAIFLGGVVMEVELSG